MSVKQIIISTIEANDGLCLDELEAMSDFEVNKLIVELAGLKGVVVNEKLSVITQSRHANCSPDYRVIDYCNNPSDIMPLATENKISLLWFDTYWEASFDFDGNLSVDGTDEVLTKHSDNENPYRAIAIVYLMMQGE